MTINRRLPCELISLILSQLNKKKDLYACTLVNHVFYKEATPLLWRHLDIGNVPTFTSITAALTQQQQQQHGQLALLGTFVRSIAIIETYVTDEDSNCIAEFSDDDLLALIQHVPFLTDLILEEGFHITDRSFEHVPQYIPHLTHLYLGKSRITQRSMEAMVRHWHPHLTRLELEYCHNLDADLFSALVPCTALQHLAITRCHLDAMNDPHIAPSVARHVLALTNLTTLRIQDCTSDYTSLVATASGATAAAVWPQLTHICLDACLETTDDMAIAFIQSHPHLTYLELRNSKITDKTLDAIPMYLPAVVEVRLSRTPGITPDGLRRLLRTCQHLELVWCPSCGIFQDHFPERDEDAMEIDRYDASAGCGGFYDSDLDEDAMEIDRDDDDGENIVREVIYLFRKAPFDYDDDDDNE
ncbi:hypothetical protein BCR42DRAFT_428053 [Absidia repens]|uniref:F-box domain-containing protein n=1 Tax=Absidia repens TaxID=90262 RepID=A0A1X2HYV9_9FUNG|nr:hypothetical protein BCR42DRAFT_428053 [Absidia repens]